MTGIRVSRTASCALAAVLAAVGLGTARSAVAAMGLGPARGAVAANGEFIANNVPKMAAAARIIGAASPSQVIDVSIWLKPHDRVGLDALAADLYQPGSSHYHAWITPAEFETRFAPTAQEARTVAEFFSSHNLQVVETGPKNMFVRARGSMGAVAKAFHVQMNNVEMNGNTYFANTAEPFVEGAAGALTGAVYGLHNLQYNHPLAARLAGAKGPSKPAGNTRTAVGSLARSSFISPTCFTGVKSESYSTNGAFPFASYKGNGYNSTSVGCGYTPAEIQAAYNLTGLYKEGYDGTGQTIVIIDWCGSPTIRADANTFSAAFGLPPLTNSNFHIISSSTPATCGAPDPEINIDVEWAHAIAPGANIDLVVPPSPSFQDVDAAVFYAVINHLGNVISGSYGSEEYFDSTAELEVQSLINEIAAIEGISANFATGDQGDFTFGQPDQNPPSVSVPADSPYATAVGGVSMALNPNKSIAWQTGWGTNQTVLVSGGEIFDPPLNIGFVFGSGGGPSGFFGKPWYQDALHGSARQLPDISWVGDPFTGAVIVISEPFQFPAQIYASYAGTSLACPMFSALWAIANQEAGVPLGQAAPYLYSMPKGTITDVLPVSSKTNVTASIREPGFTNFYSADDIAAPLGNTTRYYSALWDYPLSQDTTYVVTFGTDNFLTVTAGWDNVTGLGTPNAKAFADFFNPAR